MSNETEPTTRDSLIAAIKECSSLGLDDSIEFRTAKRAGKEGSESYQERALERIQSFLNAWKEIQSHQKWFSDKRMELLKANLDSDDIESALDLADYYLQYAQRKNLQSFLLALKGLRNARDRLACAIEQRKELKETLDQIRSLHSRLSETCHSHRRQLIFLATGLERFEAQLLHGFKPDLDKVRLLKEELDQIAKEAQEQEQEPEDHLKLTTLAFLNRNEDRLSLTESRALKDELKEVLDGGDLASRWSLWNRLNKLQSEHSFEWSLPSFDKPKLSRKAGLTADEVSEVWEMLSALLEVPEDEGAETLRNQLTDLLTKSKKKRKKAVKRIREQLSSLSEKR